MKKMISILLALSIASAVFAQPQGGKQTHGGQGQANQEKLKLEKIAFITTQVGFTEKEAEAFWPVYNQIENQQKELMKAERKAFQELNKALASGEGDIQALLDAYLKAKSENVNLHVANAKKYQKVLSAEKTARFFTCEEKFRRQQIGKLRGQRRGEFGQGGPGPGRGNKGPGEFGQGGPRGDRQFKDGKPAKDVQPGQER